MTDSLVKAVAGSTREALTALRDLVAHELESNRCSRCRASQLRSGDQAALIVQLRRLIDDLEKLGPDTTAEVSELDKIRARRAAGTARKPATEPAAPADKRGTKSAPRQQGGRTPRVRRT